MMKQIEIDLERDFEIEIKKPISICLGNFDGVHLGHQKLINTAIANSALDVGVITFSEPLGNYLPKQKNREVLTSLDDRKRLLNKLDVDYYFILKTNKTLFDLSPLDFIEKVLKKLNVKDIYVGSDYRFGKDAKGNPALLRKYFNVHLVPLLKINDQKVSSQNIIKLIKNGDIKLANKLLGYHYQMKGLITKGNHLGTEIGFPTDNLVSETPYVLPLFGVYQTITYISGIPHFSMTNVGVHPTVGAAKVPTIESHIIFYHESEDYGKTIYIEFLDFERRERKFNSIQELRLQLIADVYFTTLRALETNK